MKCPVCTAIELKMTDRQGVEIDYCPECRGVWLDRGELDKIIERSETNTTSSSSQPQYQQSVHNQQPYRKQDHDSHEYGHSGQYKKKSWISEIFD